MGALSATALVETRKPRRVNAAGVLLILGAGTRTQCYDKIAPTLMLIA